LTFATSLSLAGAARSGPFPFFAAGSSLAALAGRGRASALPLFRALNSKLAQHACKHLVELSESHPSIAFRGGWSSMTNHSERTFSGVQICFAFEASHE